MHAEFWHDRWQNNQIAFHQDGINPHLQEFLPQLDLQAGGCIFLPLCGKSEDIWWLAQQGFNVVGVELSAIAVEDFFSEHQLEPKITKLDQLSCWQNGRISLYQGDIFHLKAEMLQSCKAVFDRAALIALPAEMRMQYVSYLHACLPVGIKTLLISLTYDQAIASGPPFSVPKQEIQAYYEQWYECVELGQLDVSDEIKRIRKQGVTQILEDAYLLKPLE